MATVDDLEKYNVQSHDNMNVQCDVCLASADDEDHATDDMIRTPCETCSKATQASYFHRECLIRWLLSNPSW